MAATFFGAATVALPAEPPHGTRASRPAPVPGWQVWWWRNQPILRLPGARANRATAPSNSFTAFLRNRRPRLLLEAGKEESRGLALLQLGFQARPADLFKLLAAVRSTGRTGQAAILGLGLFRGDSTIGHLEALMRGSLTGRHLHGDLASPVPLSHRAAAAMALGLTGVPSAYQALRIILASNDLPDALGAAAIVALSFSGASGDGVRFEQCLLSSSNGPLMREAAAASLGRHAVHVPGARRVLLRVLKSDPEGGGRGAAVALWYDIDESTDVNVEGEALRAAALRSSDPVTRVLALMTLAGRGDPGAEAVIRIVLGRPEPGRSYAILATGLLAKADPSRQAQSKAMLARLRSKDSRSVDVARCILADPALLARPQRGRSLAHVAGGNACFSGASFLESILDMAAGLSQ